MRWLLVLCVIGFAAGCTDEEYAEIDNASLPIINGTLDTNPAHAATVALTIGNQSFCSGTLITPNVVLTAAHCVKAYSASWIKVFFGNDTNSTGTSVKVSKSVAHASFSMTGNPPDYTWDIGLVFLASPATVTPIPYLSKAWGITEADIGTDVDFSGFGLTELDKVGTKKHIVMPINIVCRTDGGCGAVPDRTFAYSNVEGGPCSGDSGGPAYAFRRGIEFVAGVTSAGDQNCVLMGMDTNVGEYADWIATQLGAVGSESACADSLDSDSDGLTDCADPDCAAAAGCTVPAEVCENGVDDDLDAKTDCQDPDCMDLPACILPEDCANKVDDDRDGLTDCDDPDCAGVPACTKEICDNGIDDDGDGKIDCKDYIDCTNTPYCQTEHTCDDGLDNNFDGKTDCDDPDCAGQPVCQPNHEVCTGGIDEDGDGAVDCQDADCGGHAACQQSNEICANGIDDDGDSYADCNDVDCANNAACQTAAENCFNGQDDDGDSLTDCADPDCADAAGCRSQEICDNGIDDDGDGVADCQDAACATFAGCPQSGGGGGCTHVGGTPALGALALMLLALVLWLRREL